MRGNFAHERLDFFWVNPWLFAQFIPVGADRGRSGGRTAGAAFCSGAGAVFYNGAGAVGGPGLCPRLGGGTPGRIGLHELGL